MVNKHTVDDGFLNQREGEIHLQNKYVSRQSMVGRIGHALEKNFVCSICGNGATSLTKKLTEFVEAQGVFSSIAVVAVPQNPNLKKIRKSILKQLGQRQIGNRLLILDGFWWELNDEDFKAIGIPSPSENFRIVYTSRNDDMCKKLRRHLIFYVNLLEDEEAWDLFTEQAGKSIVDLDIEETARMIVDECDGYRLAIITIASALKDKPLDAWKDALLRLQSLNRELMNFDTKVFAWIQLSFDLLNDKEARIMFLICCLFPEDSNVAVEDLVVFGKGLQVFKNGGSMNQTRDRVGCIVHQLKNSLFLLDGDEDDFVKVPKMRREFGLSVSSKQNHPYVVRCERDLKEWPLERTEYQTCRTISFICETIKQHPEDVKCPNLHLLHLRYGSASARLPNGIFEGLKNLKVLWLSIPSLSQPLSVLKKLRALCVTESILDNRYKKPRPRIGDLLGHEMKDLEIFSFSTARPYLDFPAEIGLLHNLRFLKFNRERLKYIPPGVLSKLEKLEELHLPLDFISWGCKEEGGERINASLSEVESLPLTSLTIGTSTGSILAEKLVNQLTRFRVFIGSHVNPDYEFGICGKSKRSLEVFDVDADDFGASWIGDLVRKTESLRLKQVRNLQNIITWQPKEDQDIEFPPWEKICVSDCKELEYLVVGRVPWTSFSQLKSLKLFGLYNLKELWHNGLHLSKIEGSCFGNLGEIEIMFCRKLKYVFPVSVAKELTQLQSLQICFCDDMEAILHREQISNGGNQVATSSKEEKNASEGKTQLRDQTVNASIYHESELFSLTLNSLTKRLFGRRKQGKVVTRQQQMEDEQDVAKDAIIFPQLKTMELAYMDKLRIFYDGNRSILMPLLQSLSIFRCNHLKALSYGLLETPSLQQIRINGNLYTVTRDLNEEIKLACE